MLLYSRCGSEEGDEFTEMKSLNVIIVTPYLLIPLPPRLRIFIDWGRSSQTIVLFLAHSR